MKSIRWSLILYLAVVPLAALIAVSALLYTTTFQTLRAKEESTRRLADWGEGSLLRRDGA